MRKRIQKDLGTVAVPYDPGEDDGQSRRAGGACGRSGRCGPAVTRLRLIRSEYQNYEEHAAGILNKSWSGGCGSGSHHGRNPNQKTYWPDKGDFLVATLLLVERRAGDGVFSQRRDVGRAFRVGLLISAEADWPGMCWGWSSLLLCMRIDYHRWQKWAYPLLGVSGIAALMAVSGRRAGDQRRSTVDPCRARSVFSRRNWLSCR